MLQLLFRENYFGSLAIVYYSVIMVQNYKFSLNFFTFCLNSLAERYIFIPDTEKHVNENSAFEFIQHRAYID